MRDREPELEAALDRAGQEINRLGIVARGHWERSEHLSALLRVSEGRLQACREALAAPANTEDLELREERARGDLWRDQCYKARAERDQAEAKVEGLELELAGAMAALEAQDQYRAAMDVAAQEVVRLHDMRTLSVDPGDSGAIEALRALLGPALEVKP